MIINLTPITKKLRKINNAKLVIVGTVLVVIVAGVVIASMDINTAMCLVDAAERVIEGSDFSQMTKISEKIIEGAAFK